MSLLPIVAQPSATAAVNDYSHSPAPSNPPSTYLSHVKKTKPRPTHAEIIRRNTHSIRLPPLLTPIIQRIPQRLARDLLLLTTPARKSLCSARGYTLEGAWRRGCMLHFGLGGRTSRCLLCEKRGGGEERKVLISVVSRVQVRIERGWV